MPIRSRDACAGASGVAGLLVAPCSSPVRRSRRPGAGADPGRASRCRSPDQAQATCSATSRTWSASSRDKLEQSGLTDDQIRARLRAAGYPEIFLDQYLAGADTTPAIRPGPRHHRRRPRARHPVAAGARLAPGSRTRIYAMLATRCARLLDSLRCATSTRCAPTRSPIRSDVLRPGGLKLFGLETFRHVSTQFQPVEAGRWTRTIGSARATCWS